MEHSDAFPPCFYRVSVKGLCVRDGKLLLVRESDTKSGQWELPGGGLDFGEDIHKGFEREIEEEMGLTVTNLSKNPIYAWTHRFDHNRRGFGWYYSLILAYRMEVEHLEFTPSEECVDVQFFSKDDLQHADLHRQMVALCEVFDPADFKDKL